MLSRFQFFLLILLPPCAAKAQSGMVDTEFNRLDTAAYIYHDVQAICYQPDGRIVLGGLGPDGGNIGRYLPNGSFDSSLNIGTGVNQPVSSLALQPDGRIIVGGYFSEYNGTPCSPLIRLFGDGRLDTSFHSAPGLLHGVSSLILQPNGDLTVGDYEGLFRLHSDGSRDNSFSFQLWSGISYSFVLAQQGDGKLLVWTSQHGLLRLHLDGSVDKPFNTSGAINCINPMPDGRLIVAGNINKHDGHTVNGLMRLYSNGKLDSSYLTPDLGLGNIRSSLLLPDGKLIIGGLFEPGVLRLNSDGTQDTNYNTDITVAAGGFGFSDNAPRTFCLQPDSQLLVGGYYYTTHKYARSFILRMKKDGALDNGFRVGSSVNGNANAVIVQKDKKILVGGAFDSYYGITRYNILRLYEDGALDSSFAPRLNNLVYSMALQPDGKIIIVGEFTGCNGKPAPYLVRLNSDGSTDTSFHIGSGFATSSPSTNSPNPRSVLLQRDGKVIIRGRFNFYNGSSHDNIVRLNQDGSEDSSFRILTSWFPAMHLQADGKLVLAAWDWSQDRYHIVRLDTNGQPDPGFNFQMEEGGWVSHLFSQPDGKILVNLVNDTNYLHGFIRLLPDGTRDTTFHPQVSHVYSFKEQPGIFAVQPDGKMLYATDTSIGRLTKDGLVEKDFFQSRIYSLDIVCTAFQADGKTILGGAQSVGQYQSPFFKVPYNLPVKNGLYRLQNCMIVQSQRMLDSGKVGTAYYSNIYWSAPDSAITSSLSRGALPPGLTVNTKAGVVSGIPTIAGIYRFTLMATNGQCSDSLVYSLVIDSATNHLLADWVVYG